MRMTYKQNYVWGTHSGPFPFLPAVSNDIISQDPKRTLQSDWGGEKQHRLCVQIWEHRVYLQEKQNGKIVTPRDYRGPSHSALKQHSNHSSPFQSLEKCELCLTPQITDEWVVNTVCSISQTLMGVQSLCNTFLRKRMMLLLSVCVDECPVR